MNALPPSWPEPRTDPPDDDPDGIEAAAEREHECEDGEPCPACTTCYQARGVSVCQFTCEHWRDLL